MEEQVAADIKRCLAAISSQCETLDRVQQIIGEELRKLPAGEYKELAAAAFDVFLTKSSIRKFLNKIEEIVDKHPS